MTSSNKRRWLAWAAAALLATAAPAWAQDADWTEKAGGSLVVFADVEPTNWDLGGTGGFPRTLSILATNLYDRLVKQSADGSFQPWLAESWDISEDGLVYTFHLREGVSFHDGEPFNAQAVLANIERWKGLPTSVNLTSFPFAGAEAVDDKTVVLRFDAPNARVLQVISTHGWSIHSPKAIAEHGAELADIRYAAGTGPFKFDSYSPGQGLVLVRNEDYGWAPAGADHQGPSYLERLEIRFASEAAVRIGALSTGEAQFINVIPPVNVAEVEAQGATLYAPSPSGFPESIQFNLRRDPTSDERVRKAFKYALDIPAILNSIYFGLYPQAWTVLLPDTPPAGSYDASLENSWHADPAQAVALLEEAGWTEVGSDGIRVNAAGEKLALNWILSTTADQRDVLAQAVQAEVAKVGIGLEINVLDSATYRTVRRDEGYHIGSNGAYQADADVIRNRLHSFAADYNGNLLSLSGLENEEVDELFRLGAEEVDQSLRGQYYRHIQQLNAENQWVLPFYVAKTFYASAANVRGVKFEPVGWLDSFYDTWID